MPGELSRTAARVYGRDAILEIGDISQIVAEGRDRVEEGRLEELRRIHDSPFRAIRKDYGYA